MAKDLLTRPSDREITLTRTFQAPRRLVFDAFTKPEMVKRWLWGPPEWPMVHCEIDLRVGGKLRYVWRHKDKGDMGLSGVFHEIAAPARLVNTEIFDQDWTGGEALVTTTFAEQSGIEIDLVAQLGATRLPGELETALYRIVQEALTNVVKHAEATQVSVLLTGTPVSVTAVIEDNGRGTDLDRSESGLGLTGMRERLALLDGRLRFESTPGSGTTIVAEVPLK